MKNEAGKKGTKKLLLLLPFLIFALLASIFFLQLGKDAQYMPSALIGKAMPDFTLVELESNQLTTKSDLEAKSYLVNFWGTWCPACSYEHEYLMELSYQGVPILGIDYKDDRQKAIKWLQERGNPYTLVLLDEVGKFGIDMGVTGAPETFVVNQQGVIVYRHQGIVDEHVWQEMKELM